MSKTLQKNFVNVQIWINTPETNQAKKSTGNPNPNYGCIEVWFNQNEESGLWSPTVKLTLGKDRPIRHNNETEDKTEAINWVRNLLGQMVEQYEEFQGGCGEAINSAGPYTVVMKVRAGTKAPSNSQEQFHDRNKMIVHLRSTLFNLSNMYAELRGELPQPEFVEEETEETEPAYVEETSSELAATGV
jgi:hypothetical protein